MEMNKMKLHPVKMGVLPVGDLLMQNEVFWMGLGPLRKTKCTAGTAFGFSSGGSD